MKSIKYLALFFFVFLSVSSTAQNLLSKTISLDVNRQRLDNVLEILSNKGDFYFSYNSGSIKKDSLVSFAVRNKTVKDILDMLFDASYEFKESGNYIIIRKAPIRMVLVTQKAVQEERIYSVTGYVYDEQSGSAIHQASVYEKKMLTSALTAKNGYFKLKLKSSKSRFAELSVSKEFYEDTTVVIEPRHSQQLSITLMPVDNRSLNVVVSPRDYGRPAPPQAAGRLDTLPLPVRVPVRDTGKIERTSLARLFVSARQKVQSVNLKKFFTTRPFQFSLVPGIGSHGQLSAQVVNNFSFNLLGGYTAGTNGLEIGGVFNINKKSARYFQAAGVFNAVGGTFTGFQLAGVNNMVLDSVTGMQVAGVSNLVKGNVHGMQLAGVYNHVADSVQGMQFAGVANFAHKKVSGVQFAGVINFSNRETRGVQIAGVLNYSKKLKGVQIGLINIADSSDGYSIGLINIIMKGYHKLSFYTNEINNVNAAFKTGNSKFYSILLAGLQTGTTEKLYTFGYGIGSEWGLNRKKSITVNPELTSQQIYAGSWNDLSVNNRLSLNLNIKAGKFFSIYGGPAFNVFISDQKTGVLNYRFPVQPSGYKITTFNNRITGWFGFTAGVNFF
jgi:hypothetical protein